MWQFNLEAEMQILVMENMGNVWKLALNVVEPWQICVPALKHFCFSPFAQMPPTQTIVPISRKTKSLATLVSRTRRHLNNVHIHQSFLGKSAGPKPQRACRALQNTVSAYLWSLELNRFFLWLKNSLELKVNHIKSCARLKPNKLDCQLTRLSLATFFFAEMLTSQFGKQTPAERVDLWWEGGSKSSFILNVSQKLLDYIWDVCSVFSPKQPKTCWDRTNLIEFENSILFSGSAPYQEATAMMGNVLCCVFTVK